MLSKSCACPAQWWLLAWLSPSFCPSSERSKRPFMCPDPLRGELLFSLPRCFPAQYFIALVCTQIIYEKCQVPLPGSEIRTLSNWTHMLTKYRVSCQYSSRRAGAGAVGHLCFRKQSAAASPSDSNPSSWIPGSAPFDVVTWGAYAHGSRGALLLEGPRLQRREVSSSHGPSA